MQEIHVKGNNTGLKVFVEGEPDFSKQPEDELMVVASILHHVLMQQIGNYEKRKGEYQKRKATSQ